MPKQITLKPGAPETVKKLKDAAHWLGIEAAYISELRARPNWPGGDGPYDLRAIAQWLERREHVRRAPACIERDGRNYYTVWSHEEWGLTRVEMQRIPGPRMLEWDPERPKVRGWTADQIEQYKLSPPAPKKEKPSRPPINPELERAAGTVSMKSARRLSRLSHEKIVDLIDSGRLPAEKKVTVVRSRQVGPKGKRYVIEREQESWQIDKARLLALAKPESRPEPNADPNMLPIGEIAKRIGKHVNTVRELHDAGKISGEPGFALFTVTKTKPRTGKKYEVEVRRPALLLNLQEAMHYAFGPADPHHEYDENGNGTVWLPDALLEDISGVTTMILDRALQKGRIAKRKYIPRRVRGGHHNEIKVTEQDGFRVLFSRLRRDRRRGDREFVGRELPEPIPFDADKVIPADDAPSNDQGASPQAPTVAAVQAEPESPATATHSEDFRTVFVGETTYQFTATQASIMRCLWEHAESGGEGLSQAYVLEQADAESKRLRDLFRVSKGNKTHPAWGTLIRSVRRGVFALNLPEN